MTRTFTVSLGSSPLAGKQAMDQVSRFKAQLRSLQKQPESVRLLTVVGVEPSTTGVTAMYDADDPCAVEWVKQAQAVSAELWQTLAERRKGADR